MPDTAFSFRSIISKETPDFTLRVESDPAGMEARAFIFPKNPAKFPSHDKLSMMLREAGVVHGLDMNSIKLACSVAVAGAEQRGIVLAKATLPVHGQDERIKFLVQPNSDRVKFETIEKDRLAGEALHLIANICEGDEIGRLEAPTDGLPGMNIFGLSIPAKDGVFMTERPSAGDGVIWDGLAKGYYAARDGRVVFERNTISVTDKFVLQGDVNRRSGPVEFIGDVEIIGSVTDGFKVKARSIRVRGRVGDCLLEAAGDIVLSSMNGGYSGTVRCGGGLRADTLMGAFLEVKGDIEVKSQMSRCVVKCGGAILARTARIEGGSCMAFRGVDALTLGTPKESRTTICVGRCPFTERLLVRYRREMSRKSRRLHRAQRMIAPYVYDHAKLEKLSAGNRRDYNKLYGEFKTLAEEISVHRSEIEALKAYQANDGNPVVNVRGMLMRGVVITIGATSQEIGMPVRSPVTIVENVERRILDFQRLRSDAVESKSMGLNDTGGATPSAAGDGL